MTSLLHITARKNAKVDEVVSTKLEPAQNANNNGTNIKYNDKFFVLIG